MFWKRVKKIDIDYNLTITLSHEECLSLAKDFMRPGEDKNSPVQIDRLEEARAVFKEEKPFADKVWDFIKEIENNDFTP